MQGEAFLQGFPPDRAVVGREKGNGEVSHPVTDVVFPWEQRKGNDGASFYPS